MGTHAYIYRAVDPAGAARDGQLVCASRGAALEALSRLGLVPVELREAESTSNSASDASTAASPSPGHWSGVLARRLRWRASDQVSQREVQTLTQSLAALLMAGLTIDRALQISASLAPGGSVRSLTEKLLERVRSGKTLSESIDASGQKVPAYYSSMVNAGEVGGSLPGTLARVAELMRRQLEIGERIRSALIYPGMLAGVVLVTLVVLLTFVLPRFEILFAESEAPLPFSTRAVLAMGRFVASYWWLMLAVAVGAITSFTLWLRSAAGRVAFDGWLLKSRLTFRLPSAIATSRFLRTLSTLCANGLPLAAALRVARGTVGNSSMLSALGAVLREVQAGEPFSESLARASIFPPVAAQLARVGEETGRLDQMLLSAADVLEEETRLSLERLLSLLVPLLTVGMGLVVAALIGSVLIGLLSINDLAV